MYRAGRFGPWTLIRDRNGQRYMLFHLGRDPGETRNLAAERPGLVRELAARLRLWRRLQRGYYDGGPPWRAYPPDLRLPPLKGGSAEGGP